MRVFNLQFNIEQATLVIISLIAILVSSTFVTVLGSIVSLPKTVHSSGGLVQIFSATGFLSLAVLHWNAPSVIESIGVDEDLIPDPEYFVRWTVISLGVVYFFTTLKPYIQFSLYEYPVSTSQFLTPFILAAIMATSILTNHERQNENIKEMISTQFLKSALLLGAVGTDQPSRLTCSFCGEDLTECEEFYERVCSTPQTEQDILIEQFCSPLCVAASERTHGE